MYSGTRLLLITVIFLFTLLLNIPFGYLRGKTKKFSFKWFLYIHLPIPFVLLARILSNTDMTYIPLLVLAAVIGQVWGGKLEFKS
ncbi:MAG: hypothetical protein A3J81_06940 [Nitrospirae bacterium RIFOXYB2_FULL_43_5]|nr:MAG: hypothetical protein A2X54_04600 [Nitrospirae bacterium GWF2_44_13]OGW63909.1 MAG: hypothetical protein A2222_05175 [Nitrospirae bacterium RIFOXYA2_FULL_44_9]OGW77611.1 MAG: hypothetical protein A3J81_06940 [Nitrospirae bacterium RIFOXYB2_FULL_43_5]HBG93241.1 hypothetical protein [Nitrospiraceae bacterium]